LPLISCILRYWRPGTKALAASGIKRVFVAMLDPDPKNSSAGIKILKAADIEISVGLLEEDALTTVAGTWPNKVSRNGSRNLPFLIRV